MQRAADDPKSQIQKKRESQQRSQLRLSIAVPVLLVLFPLAYGLISVQLHENFLSRLSGPTAQDTVGASLRMHLYMMLLLSGVALVTGVGLVYFEILRPIRAIQDAMGRITRGESYHPEARRFGTAPELGDLSNSFNGMINFVNSSIQERNRYMLESINTGILTADRTGRVVAVNVRGEEILGFGSADLIGLRPRTLRERSPARLGPIADFIEACLRGDSAGLPEVIELGSAGVGTLLHIAPSILRDEDDELSGIILNFRDAARIQSLHERLARTDRLAALGTFSMGLAHELRNPLGSIKGTAQLLKMEAASGAITDAAVYTDRIVQETDRLDRFLAELLDFSSNSVDRPALVDMNEVITSALNQVRWRFEERFESGAIHLIQNLGAIPLVLIESNRMVQAISNILRNAVEAMPDGERLTIETKVRTERGLRYVEARIHNTGSSIPPADRSKVLDPFFTTKERGSGLGLAIAYQIITHQPGTLDIEGGEDDVAFILRFPAARSADTAVPAVTPVREALVRGKV